MEVTGVGWVNGANDVAQLGENCGGRLAQRLGRSGKGQTCVVNGGEQGQAGRAKEGHGCDWECGSGCLRGCASSELGLFSPVGSAEG